MKLFGKKVIDWSKLSQVPEADQKAMILGAISVALKALSEQPLGAKAATDVLGTKALGADPTMVVSAPPIIVSGSDTIDAPDRGYEALFKEIDMRQSTSKTFEMNDITGGVTFYQQVPGEEAKLSKLPKSAQTNVSMLRFTGGFPILDDWIRFNELYKMDALTEDTVKRWYDQKANLFYGMLTALGAGINQAFATDDVTTINNACAQIMVDLEAAGAAISSGSKFYITCHPNLMARIYKALAAVFTNPNTNNNQIVWMIAGVIPTTKIAATSYYVSLPGYKSVRGEWDDLNTREPQRNELKLGADHVWTGAYNGAIASTLQHRRCALS
ncbi:hypothetical protein [Geopsychrobacter electrodiphilus]|uniref:hypothetical protein n=1 Tax=Geopsychrobacter electrodiphilus TaxID=225196 RepID=UPI00037CA11A|nr:hypothetical protein [Geopsychrobacter electrodiphilus]